MSKTTLTFYGGLRTIGGTIIALQYEDSRVIFDFGLTYNPAANIFDGQVQPRKSAIIRDYLKLGLIPAVDGIYNHELLPDQLSIRSAQEYNGNTAVLISHLHLDHMGAMGFIDSSIPVYMTRDSLRLYTTLEKVGEGIVGERTYQSCDYNQSFTVGAIKITPLQLDHDVLGACAFHIETPDGAIVYTGDLRMHGAHPERVETFIKSAKALGFDAVIMEGTTLRSEEELAEELLVASKELPEDLLTESMIADGMTEILRSTQGIGFFNIYQRNIDRIHGILKAGRESGRKVVFEAATAEIAFKILEEQDFFIYESEALRESIVNGTVPEWQQELIQEFHTVSYHDINLEPSKFFVQNSYDQSLELFDLHVTDGVYLHSNGVPLGAFDPAYENLERILATINLERVEVGTSGHAIPQHLRYIVDELDPAVLIPLHSFYPERLKARNGVQLLPEYDKVYVLSKGSVKEQ